MAYDINKCPTIGESGLVKLAGLTRILAGGVNYSVDTTDSPENYTYMIIPFGYSYTTEGGEYWYGSTITFSISSSGRFTNKYTTPDGYEHSFSLSFSIERDQPIINFIGSAEGVIHIVGVWGVV